MSSDNGTITDDEKAFYDRQIRLWGLEAQNRLRSSSVLIAGLSGCGSEVAKNLMLAGLKSLTLLDHKTVSPYDHCSQLLLSCDSVGKNRAEASLHKCKVLNPNVHLRVDTDDITNKDEDFFAGFDLVILVDQKYSVVSDINKICRKIGKPFIAGGVFGWIGYAFFDFTDCPFLITIPKVSLGGVLEDEVLDKKRPRLDVGIKNGMVSDHNAAPLDVVLDDDEKVEKKFTYPLWHDAWNVDWSHKKFIRKKRRYLPRSYFPIRVLLRLYDVDDNINQDKFMESWKKELVECNQDLNDEFFDIKFFSRFISPQLSPAAAIVGALMAQEAIKVLSQKDEPLKNVFLYSAIDSSGVVCHLPP
ncbi:unnamed protein product [Thelazia callipaeda]|uniref:ThiF domain-containing protein n=1 Tax=Thelazia callipaeda TaxID=103827 RepID=A0A0N5D044_THECL|nr:unnamed protein product [Thelazia callipaeda]